MARDPLDRYYTPDALAAGCLSALVAHHGGAPSALLEPCSGGGAFGRAALALGVVHVLGCDPDPGAEPGYPCARLPVAEWAPHWAPHDGRDVWIVTNPHYVGIYDTIAVMRALQARVSACVLGLLLRETTIGHMMAGDDPPHELWVSPIRPRWGGAGGEQHKSGDTCGSVLAAWGRAPLRTATTIRTLPAWRTKGARS